MICVLAFDEPPPHWGFKPSRAGTSWWIRLEDHRVPACLKALDRLGIRANALDPEPDTRPNERPRGRAARATFDARQTQKHTARYIHKSMPKAKAIAEAARIENLKRNRAQHDEAKRRREFARQADQKTQRDQQLHAQHIAQLLTTHYRIGVIRHGANTP